MKIPSCIFFLVVSHASKNLGNEEIIYFKPDDGCKTNDIVIEFKDLEKQNENLPNSAEEVKTGEVLVDHIDLKVKTNRPATLDDVFKKQHLARKILSYLETDTDQFAISLTNICKYFTNSMLTLYKESIRNYPSKPEIYSFNRILCLSANDFRFRKAFCNEIAASKPKFFTQIHDLLKAKAQMIPDFEEYFDSRKLWDLAVGDTLCNFKRDAPGGDVPEYQEYEKLAIARNKIVREALLEVNKYNKPREKAISLIKKTNRYLLAGFFFMFTVYVCFLFLPFQSEFSQPFHLLFASFSLPGNLVMIGVVSLLRETGGFFAQIPKNVLKFHLGFGAVTGIFNVIGAFVEYRSFVTYLLTKIFFGSFLFLPIFLVLLRAAYRDYISKPTTAPNEIREAKKTIRNIQRSYFVDN